MRDAGLLSVQRRDHERASCHVPFFTGGVESAYGAPITPDEMEREVVAQSTPPL